ncbi:MAG TPA: 2-oxoglutarate dehydrogenase E1 component [Rhizobiales bacterium]|nr:2-oxoglutarate dehydrogenase E1 component [Hyphomicrobiales bacterium]
MSDKPRSQTNQDFLNTGSLSGTNAPYLEQMQKRWLADPASVDASWRDYFEGLHDRDDIVRENADGPSWRRKDWPKAPTEEIMEILGSASALDQIRAQIKEKQPTTSAEALERAARDSIRALMLIRAYRIRGHMVADLDPLGLMKRVPPEELDPSLLGFGPEDRERPIYIGGVLGMEYATINEMLAILRRTYCGTFGVQFMHVSNAEERSWLQKRIEGPDKVISFTPQGRKAILQKLIEAQAFEDILQRRYPGTKRFGLDGGESLIPALEQIIKRGGQLGLKDINFGMPHRGRLNVLAAVLKKPYEAIFYEFLGGVSAGVQDFGSGDVKYHLGASSDREFDGNKVHLSLAPNPSHLEAVDAVVIGKTRAKQQLFAGSYQNPDTQSVASVLLHGDAAFAGQGVVSECFGMSALEGYGVGGTIHVIVNNQIGFTTAPHYSRSTPYPTDVAMMVETPIFHVNGDDPEAVVFAARIATEYRQKFGRDIVIDMICYRRYGHNEGDDPSFTQPIMYKVIKKKKPTRDIYGERLINEGVITADEFEAMKREFSDYLDAQFEAAVKYQTKPPDWLDGVWAGLQLPDDDVKRRGKKQLAARTLRIIGKAITEYPEDIAIHRTLKRLIAARRERIETGKNIDWALAEHLAFGSLLVEGFPVRLSGQDCGRGTFSQRHSHIIDQNTEERYTPLNHIRDGQACYQVIDSLLSEYAVLGFEYGFSITRPNTLTIWEAQFGDFANGAQVVFDQFISSAEQKWLRMSGLVVLLPHGYEGQGPEHSSARPERYLQMAAQDNMQICNLTTPANYYHALRRQLHRDFRKPLIVFTPKSLLRHKRCVSTLEEMGKGSNFHRVLWDDADYNPLPGELRLKPDDQIRRVILCNGKVYYDLFEEREKLGREDIYILRIEQLFPYPGDALEEELSRFKAAEFVWVQEEPQNMGAWAYIRGFLEITFANIKAKTKSPVYIGRPASASTATGIAAKHKAEQQAILDEALNF